MQRNFKLYYITDKYINYLRSFDKNVPYNKNSTRPYIGIVYTYNNINYFAPLSSPKEKHLKMSSSQLDIYKIDNGKLGIVNINNMLPTPIECLTEVLPTINDLKYRTLLEKQLSYINNPVNAKRLLNKVRHFQNEYRSSKLSVAIIKRTCNFPLLEEKCKEWNKIQEENIENSKEDKNIDIDRVNRIKEFIEKCKNLDYRDYFCAILLNEVIEDKESIDKIDEKDIKLCDKFYDEYIQISDMKLLSEEIHDMLDGNYNFEEEQEIQEEEDDM